MNILYVTPYVPSRIRSRPYNLIQALVGLDHQITLLTAAGTLPEEQTQANVLRNWGVRVEVFPVSLTRSLYNCLMALPIQEPLQASYSYHLAMEQRLSELLRENTFDVVHIEHLRASRLVRAIIPPRSTESIPAVYDSVDCISLLFEQATQSGAPWPASSSSC